AAKAALMVLSPGAEAPQTVTLDLIPESSEIPIHQVAQLDTTSALAITLSDPGDNLDLTRNTPIWAWVKSTPRQSQPLILEAGEGLGKTQTGEPAIYYYARQLFERNLVPLIPENKTIIVSIILPEGRQLASRTSNAAFGILEGLALLGTSGISQPLSSADHLDEFRQDLQCKVKNSPHLTFCIGNNGLRVAQRLGISESAIVQTGNWIGALLVEAGLHGAESILLLGYQGKLIKLAGGIFNTSSHIADAKLEILSAAVVRAGGDMATVEAVLQAKTADAAYLTIKERGLAEGVFNHLAKKINLNAQNYVKKYADTTLNISTILFDRKGEIITQIKP
ncbi:MAG TPA: cobalt-precorrin-5B (C(1))-methyltransferase CbiD, partial [Vampirovibrionales bacterium]